MNKNIFQLRNDYCACIKLADETDSKKEDIILRQEAKVILEDLKQNCPHEDVVCLRSEYDGSYTRDYDDHCPEERLCLCCSSFESAYGNKFKVLINVPFARFEMGFYNNKLPEQMKTPLKFLLSEIKEFALEKGYRYNKR